MINKYPEARVIFSGGSGSLSNNTLTHASVAKQFFEKVGIKPERILYEDKSRNTYENILFSKEIAKPNINQKWLLVTSAFHLKRSLNIAEKLEWNFIPYATDFNKSKKFSWKISFNILSHSCPPSIILCPHSLSLYFSAHKNKYNAPFAGIISTLEFFIKIALTRLTA